MTCQTQSIKAEYLTWMAHLRHELYTPLNAIHGYSELLLEELEDTGSDEGDFGKVLAHLHQVGGKIFTLISQSMNGEILCTRAEQTPLFNLQNGEGDHAVWAESWATLKQDVFLGHLQALSLELEQVVAQLQILTPKQFNRDIEKVAIASKNFKIMIKAVLQSQSWPCPLWSNEVDSSDTALSPVLTELEPEAPPDFKLVTGELIQENRASEAILPNQFRSVQESILEATTTAAQTLSKKVANVLVIDDNSANCDLLCRYILRQGHQVTPVSSGLQALAQIKTGEYDLILLDILMPEMNGYEVLEWIRNSEWRHLSVIMISSLDELDSIVKCIEMGAEDYLPKPFNPILLKARIDACLEKKRMRDQEVKYLDELAIANEKITQLNDQLKLENCRLSAELDISQRIQQMMLPRPQDLSQIEGLDVVGFMKPADEVGGDYYDVICTDNGVIFGIGDVTGHGLESGLLMLMIQTAVRTLVEQGGCDYQYFLDVINRTLLSNAERMETSRNATLSLVHYHKGKLNICGQHEEVIVIRNDGSIEHIDTINLGFPMGLDHDISDFLGKTEVNINLNDIVVLYTDGITEAENKKGQFYGIDRLSQIVAKNRSFGAAEIRDVVISNLTKYIQDHQIFDDITLLVMKRTS